MMFNPVVIELLVFAAIGGLLGYFALRDNPSYTLSKRIQQLLLSIGSGMFFAYGTYQLLQELTAYTGRVCLVISGGIAFGGTDLVIKLGRSLWNSIIEALIRSRMPK